MQAEQAEQSRLRVSAATAGLLSSRHWAVSISCDRFIQFPSMDLADSQIFPLQGKRYAKLLGPVFPIRSLRCYRMEKHADTNPR